MEYTYKPTTHGRAVMAACMALEKPFHVTRVAFGSGKVEEDTNLADVHELLEYVADGAVADRSHKDDRFCLTIQYANSEHKDVKTFLLSEFIVYGEDPATGAETDLIYGSLGDYRQPVPAYNPAYPPSVFNFPLEIILSDEINVSISAPAGLVTFEDLRDYQGKLLREIMMGEISLPLTSAGGDALLAGDGMPLQAVYKVGSMGNIMAAVAQQISAAKQEVLAAAASDAAGRAGAAKREAVSAAAAAAETKVNAARSELTAAISAQIATHNEVSTAHPTHLAVVTKS
jgi:hypothetical protein